VNTFCDAAQQYEKLDGYPTQHNTLLDQPTDVGGGQCTDLEAWKAATLQPGDGYYYGAAANWCRRIPAKNLAAVRGANAAGGSEWTADSTSACYLPPTTQQAYGAVTDPWYKQVFDMLTAPFAFLGDVTANANTAVEVVVLNPIKT